MLIPVQAGSEWTIAGSDLCERIRVRIEAISDGIARCKSTKSERRYDIRVSTLAHGKRGATLILNPDGTPFDKPPRRKTRPEPADKTASDFRRVVVPRSTPSSRALQAATLIREGVSRQDVAARMGVSVSSVTKWCAMVREEGRQA